jgi:hypothetical protein
MPCGSQLRELPLDRGHLRFAIAALLLTLEVFEAPLPVQMTKAMLFLSIMPALTRVPQAENFDLQRRDTVNDSERCARYRKLADIRCGRARFDNIRIG